MQSQETKSVDGATAFNDLHRAFEAFRETNDERLSQLETRMGSDVITEEKLQRIDRALEDTKSRLDRALLSAARPQLSNDARDDDFATFFVVSPISRPSVPLLLYVRFQLPPIARPSL